MGIDADALLYFGFDLGGEAPSWYEDWEKIIVEKLTDGAVVEPAHHDYDRDWPNYWAAQRALRATFPAGVNDHSYCEDPVYFVHGRLVTAYYGQPEAITFDLGVAAAKAEPDLRRLCDMLEVPWQTPTWRLASRLSH